MYQFCQTRRGFHVPYHTASLLQVEGRRQLVASLHRAQCMEEGHEHVTVRTKLRILLEHHPRARPKINNSTVEVRLNMSSVLIIQYNPGTSVGPSRSLVLSTAGVLSSIGMSSLRILTLVRASIGCISQSCCTTG